MAEKKILRPGRGSNISSRNTLFSWFKGCHAFFTDPCAFTAAFTLVKQFCTTNIPGLVQNNRVNIRRRKRKYSFHTNAIRDFTNREACREAAALFLNYIAFKRLNTLFITLYNLIVYGNIITRLEIREFLLAV